VTSSRVHLLENRPTSPDPSHRATFVASNGFTLILYFASFKQVNNWVFFKMT